jgi:hypothetical protein
MNKTKITLALFVATLLSGTAFAATPAEIDQQRDVNQQQRIENGLQSGQLNTREAGRLEREQQHVDRMEARDLKDGQISGGEQLRLDRAQNAASADIYRQKHDAQTGNPSSASSQRVQTDVQRNVNQQQRIQNGVDNGSLTNREASRLEAGQAQQGRIRRSENRQSANVYRKKHNARTK